MKVYNKATAMKSLSMFVLILAMMTNICVAMGNLKPGDDVSSDEVESFERSCQNNMPRLWSVLERLLTREEDVRFIIAKEGNSGRASCDTKGIKCGITLSLEHFMGEIPSYQEDRLIVVLYHEMGHVKYMRNRLQDERDAGDNGLAAFRNSLMGAKARADQKGDKGPLREVLCRLEKRRNNNNPGAHDEHLKDFVGGDLWKQCEAVVPNRDCEEVLNNRKLRTLPIPATGLRGSQP